MNGLMWMLCLFILTSFKGVTCKPDNEGNSFTFLFPGNSANNMEMALLISTSSTNQLNVNVSIPLFLNDIIQVIVSRGSPVQVPLVTSARAVPGLTEHKGIQVTASGEIVVQAILTGNNKTTALSVLPVDVLSDFYFIPGNAAEPSSPSLIAITGIVDGTQTTLYFPSCQNFTLDSQNYVNQNQALLLLDSHQTILLQISGDISRTEVRSTAPVSVMAGSEHINMMIVPVAALGRHYLVPSLGNRVGDSILRILVPPLSGASVVLVTVNSASGSTSYRIQREHYQDISGNANSHYSVTATRHVMVLHFATFENTSTSMSVVIPAVEQFENEYIFMMTNPTKSYISITAEAKDKDDITVDGQLLSTLETIGGWTQVANSEYWTSAFQVTNGSHFVSHNSPFSRFLVIWFEITNGAFYGTNSGSRISPLYDYCENMTMLISDGLDNDCDNKVDEELCDNMDDDGDGEVDEDCDAMLSISTLVSSSTTAKTEHNYKNYVNPSIPVIIAVVLSFVAGTAVAISFVVWFKVRKPCQVQSVVQCSSEVNIKCKPTVSPTSTNTNINERDANGMISPLTLCSNMSSVEV